jgi:hypothetical protein
VDFVALSQQMHPRIPCGDAAKYRRSATDGGAVEDRSQAGRKVCICLAMEQKRPANAKIELA